MNVNQFILESAHSSKATAVHCGILKYYKVQLTRLVSYHSLPTATGDRTKNLTNTPYSEANTKDGAPKRG